MDKEKILEKARMEKKDEGLEYIKRRGLELGYIVFVVFAVFLIFFKLAIGKNTYDIQALFWAFIAAEVYSKYRFTKKKWSLVACIAGALASIGNLINYILYTLW